jgi:drug/metabolite transporter (DMT)-like permease
MALFGVILMGLNAWGTDQWATLPARLNFSVMAGLAFLGVVATAGMLFLQARAQRFVSADKAALVYSMEPVFAALFAWAWLSEALSLQSALGGAMVVGAVILSELRAARTPTAVAVPNQS